jgi:hypothetical protein
MVSNQKQKQKKPKAYVFLLENKELEGKWWRAAYGAGITDYAYDMY